jgi:hypothetical protein
VDFGFLEVIVVVVFRHLRSLFGFTAEDAEVRRGTQSIAR